MRLTGTLVLCAACLAIAAPARADDAQRVCPKADTMLYAPPIGTLTFLPSEGMTCNYLDSGQHHASKYGLIIDPNAVTVDSDARAAVDSLWPLAVGKKAKFRVTRGTAAWTEEVAVTGTKDIDVDGTTHHTFVLVRTETGDLGPFGRQYIADSTYYIDPTFGFTVMFAYRMNSGRGMPSHAPDWTAHRIVLPSQ